jgi:hypothetical protein
MPDIRSRQQVADHSYFALRSVWESRKVTTEHRLGLFRHQVAVMKYGNQAWRLTEGKGGTRAAINGWAGKRLAPIIGTQSARPARAVQGSGSEEADAISEQILAAAAATQVAEGCEASAIHQQSANPAVPVLAEIDYDRRRYVGRTLWLPRDRLVRIELMEYARLVARGWRKKEETLFRDCPPFATGKQLAALACALPSNGATERRAQRWRHQLTICVSH